MFTFSDKAIAAEQLLAKYRWKQVEVPRTWSPSEAGAQLVGFYAGRTTRRGAFGQYDVALVLVPGEGAFMVSGIKLMQLLDASMIEEGHPVCVVYQGEKEIAKNHNMKLFDLLVADGEALDRDAMPSVSVAST